MLEMNPTGDKDKDAQMKQHLEKELARISRNAERRVAREKAKGKMPNSPAGAGSPAQSDADAGNSNNDGTPQKGQGRGRNKDGTARKCANCGQVGHIKTNRKSVNVFFRCVFCDGDEWVDLDDNKRGRRRDSAVAGSVLHDSYSKFTL